PSKGFGAASWVDLSGNLWMFGGAMMYNYNDLWKYDILNNTWTWMKGPNIPRDSGNYGIQGVPNPANYPSSRSETAVGWIDRVGDLWLYGGLGAAALSDLWRYNISTNIWTWINGSPLIGIPGNYGTQ